jgi:HAD superfamily hydrolase (TIGR01509 family)
LKNTSLQAVLWDLDGTLVNTADLHYQATYATLTKNGITFDRPTFNTGFGMADHAIMGKAAPGMEEAAFQAMVAEKNALYRTLVDEAELEALPGVVHWLTTFRGWGLRQMIVSTTFAENIQTIAHKLRIEGFFAGVVSTIQLGLPSKPHPDGFLKAAELLHLSAQDCLVIEDAPAGVEAARRAGMKCLAVGTSNPLDRLAAADLAVPDLDHLQIAQARRLLNLPKAAD